MRGKNNSERKRQPKIKSRTQIIKGRRKAKLRIMEIKLREERLRRRRDLERRVKIVGER